MSYGDHIMSDADGNAVPGIQLAVVTLTDSQIKALPTTPISFGPLPGSGNWNRAIFCSYNFDTNAAAYTNINAAFAALSISGGTLIFGPINDTTAVPNIGTLSALLGATGKRVHSIQIPYAEAFTYAGAADYVLSPVYETHAAVDNAQFSISMDNNGSGNLTGGNAANKIIVTVGFITLSLT